MSLDSVDIPTNLYGVEAPARVRILENQRLTPNDASDIRHLVIDLAGFNFRYIEGQAIGLVVPATPDHAETCLRYYSIASTRHGDDGKGRSVSICVKRIATSTSFASDYVCNLSAGDEVDLVGPFGPTFSAPHAPDTPLILAATGTGIAPFRGIVRHLLADRSDWTAPIWLFHGVRARAERLYRDEFESFHQRNREFQLHYAISREEWPAGTPCERIQHGMERHGSALWNLITRPSSRLYVCGVRGMEDAVEQVFIDLAAREGRNWSEMRSDFLEQGRLRISTY